MNTRAKRFERMKSHPGDNWTISDVEAVCGEYGLICLPPRGGGSHYKVSPLTKSEILPIPSHRPIKAVYIRKLIAMIERFGKMGV